MGQFSVSSDDAIAHIEFALRVTKYGNFAMVSPQHLRVALAALYEKKENENASESKAVE